MIAIKNIKMPVNCEECFARMLAWCLLDEEERIVVPAVPWEVEERPDWCPLVDVPDEVGKGTVLLISETKKVNDDTD